MNSCIYFLDFVYLGFWARQAQLKILMQANIIFLVHICTANMLFLCNILLNRVCLAQRDLLFVLTTNG